MKRPAVFFLLAVLTLAAIACGADDKPGARSTPSTGPLTADDILALASSAMKTSPSYRIFQRITYENPDEGTQSGTMTVEWAAPDRMRRIQRYGPEDGPIAFGLIRIGDRSYLNFGDQDSPEWREAETSSPGEDNSPSFVLGLTGAMIAGAEILDGVSVYRIEGKPSNLDQMTGDFDRVAASSQTVFISTSDFRPLRFQSEITWEYTEESYHSTPGGERERRKETKQAHAAMQADITYLSEPLVIEAPEVYRPLQTGDDDLLLHTPTAIVPSLNPTATPTPVAFPTFAPDDPNRNIPFFLNDAPRYDKLELENGIIVSYPACNPNSIADRWSYIVIYYMPDGSRAANGSLRGRIVDEEKGTLTARPDFLEFTDTAYFSEEGRAAIESVLSNPELINQILEHAAMPARCPAEFVQPLRDRFDSFPAYDKLVIDDGIVAFFQSCDTDYDGLAAPVVIEHFPTQSVIGITPGKPGFEPFGAGTPSGYERLRQIAEDEELMERVAELAPREARCG